MLRLDRTRLCAAAALVGVFLWNGTPTPVQAAGTTTNDWCYETCGPEADCDTLCENDGGGTITCGEYQGGSSNGWCAPPGPSCADICSLSEACNTSCYDEYENSTTCEYYNNGECSNSCDVTCSPLSSTGSEYCTDSGGGSSDCETYGVYLRCGDGICAPDEMCSCGDCSEYCPSNPIPPELVEELPQEPTFNQASSTSACAAAVANGWANGWSCPTWEWVSSMDPNSPSCAGKNAVLADVTKALIVYQGIGDALWASKDCVHYPELTECRTAQAYYAALLDGANLYSSIQELPCYLY